MRCNWNSRFVSRREFIACGAVMSGASGTKALASLAKDEESPVRLEGTASRPNGFRKLRGTIAAIITPHSGAGPDHARLLSLAHHLLDSGCDGLNLLGTTGEATSLSVDERLGLMAAVAGSNLPKERLMVGTGAAALSDAVKLSKGATQLGFSGLLLLPPFYYKNVTESGIIAYVSQIVEATAASSASIYLYNYPALSGVTYTLPMIAELLRRHGTRIAGVKDSSGDFAYARAATKLSKTFDVFPSTEASLLEARSGVFAGCISATANVTSVECGKAFRHGDAAALRRAVAIRRAFEGVPLVPAVKYIVSKVHQDPNLCRVIPPLAELDKKTVESLETRLRTVEENS